jgi:hypothetical protein
MQHSMAFSDGTIELSVFPEAEAQQSNRPIGGSRIARVVELVDTRDLKN